MTTPGDEEMVNGLEARVDSFDVDAWWRERDGGLVIPGQRSENLPTPSCRLHNSFGHLPSCAWQLTETVEAFLKRLPPSTTDATPEVPWIWICNPYLPTNPDTTPPSGHGHDGPDVGGSHVLTYIREAIDILNEFRDNRDHGAGAGNTTAHKQSNPASDILDLAHRRNIRSGKVR